MKNEKGITLVALIIIVAVLLIIASVSIYSGKEALDNVNLENFYMQLEIVQKRVDDIAATNESYINSEGNKVEIKNQGKELNQSQKTKLIKILEYNEIDSTDIIDDFKYFTVQDIKDILDLAEIEYNLFINFEKRIIVAEKGIVVEGISYHLLKNSINLVEQNTDKNKGTIEELEYGSPIEYINGTYKVTVEPKNTIGDLNKTGHIKYKRKILNFWEITNQNYIIIESGVEYDIVYIDLNNNSIEKTIQIVENEKNELIVEEISTGESEEN